MKRSKWFPGMLLVLSGLCVACSTPNSSSESKQSSSNESSVASSSKEESSSVSSEEPSEESSELSSEESSSLESSGESSSEAESSLEANQIAVHFETGDEEVIVEDAMVDEGGTLSKPYPVREGYALRRWLLDGKEFDFSTPITETITLVADWVERTNLPTMMVELRDSSKNEISIDSVTREEYVSSRISIVNKDGDFDQKDTASSFKGRGNGSWADAKKGYKIKFDKKQSLFGRTANKHWVILACTNFSDGTMLRNFSAYNMAGSLFSKLEYTTNAVWIDVYVNGEYRGVYVLCEHVRVGKGRVDIASDYGVLDTGYLIEYDAYASGTEGIDYFDITDSSSESSGGEGGGTSGDNPGGDPGGFPGFPGGNPGGNPGGFPGGFPGGGGGGDIDIHSNTNPHGGIVRYNFTVHSPDPEDFEEEVTEEEYRAQVAFIKDYVKQVYVSAITDHDFATFSTLADTESLVDMYILHEFYKNTDTGYSSFYMYKKPGGKLYFGPAWDFDATTTAARDDENNPNGIYVAGSAKTDRSTTWSELYMALYEIEEFRNLVKARYQQLNEGMGSYYDGLFTNDFYEENRKALGKNFVRWHSNNSFFPGGPFSTYTQEKAESDWINNCKTLYEWFKNRLVFLNTEWALPQE